MNEQSAPPPKSPVRALTREERLAAQLRENLRRRKAQARALHEQDESGALPKAPGKS